MNPSGSDRVTTDRPGESAEPITTRQFFNIDSARRFLRPFYGDHFAMSTLRDLVAERFHHSDVSTWNDNRVLEFVAWKLASGRLRIADKPGFRFTGGGASPAEQPPEAEEPPPAPVSQVTTETHWIEIEMVGEDDKPIPGVRYMVKQSDGTSVASGRLDRLGFIRATVPESGSYQISFPDLDKEAWEKI